MRGICLRLQPERMKRALITAFGAAVVACAASGEATAPADQREPLRGCPGNPKTMPYIVNPLIDWDWSVCHTWYPTNYGMGNVTSQGLPTSIWDGDNPPIEPITRHGCPPIAFMCP